MRNDQNNTYIVEFLYTTYEKKYILLFKKT